MNSNPLFAFLNGKTFKLNGVEGVFQHKITEVRYPYKRTEESLYHNPTANGKRSVAYKREKQALGDDWNTDLTHSDTAVEAAIALGY